MPINNRLGHRKSRNGCTRCKRRHVKCDEKRPCSNCFKHNLPCSLTSAGADNVDHTAVVSPDHAGDGAENSGDPSASPGRQERLTHPHGDITKVRRLLKSLSSEIEQLAESKETPSQPTPPCTCKEEFLEDLQLMHHFTTSTALTIFDDASAQNLQVWQCAVPELSFSCDTLRHAVLALSATHRIHITPDERDRWKSALQRHLPAATVPFASSLDQITAENADRCFMHTLLKFAIEIYGIAQDPVSPSLSTVCETFKSLQELSALLLSDLGDVIGKGSIPLIFNITTEWLPLLSENLELTHRLRQVEKLSRGEAELQVMPEVSKPCLAALEILRMTCRTMIAPLNNRGRVWAWVFFLPNDFLQLLSSGEPLACVILVHFAALVRFLEDDFWYCRGWSAKVSFLVHAALPSQWWPWIEWPHDCIRQGLDIRCLLET